MRAGDGYSGAVTEGRQKGAGFAHERLAAWVSTQGVGGDRYSYGYLADFRVAHSSKALGSGGVGVLPRSLSASMPSSNSESPPIMRTAPIKTPIYPTNVRVF